MLIYEMFHNKSIQIQIRFHVRTFNWSLRSFSWLSNLYLSFFRILWRKERAEKGNLQQTHMNVHVSGSSFTFHASNMQKPKN